MWSRVRFLRYLCADGRRHCFRCIPVPGHRRYWMVNEPAKRTNRRDDSPRASLLASRASSFYRIGRPRDEERKRKGNSCFASWSWGLQWIRISRSSDGIVPHFLLLHLLPMFLFFILTRDGLLKDDSFRGGCRVNACCGIFRAQETKAWWIAPKSRSWKLLGMYWGWNVPCLL